MMQELDSHQKKESLQRSASPRQSTETQSVISSGNAEKRSRKPSARRSLDYSDFPAVKTSASDTSYGLDESQSGGLSDVMVGEGRRLSGENLQRSVDDSVTQEVDTPESKKQVRIVSPTGNNSHLVSEEPLDGRQRQNVSNSTDTGLSEGKGTRQMASPSSLGSARTNSRRSRDGIPLSSAENQARMIQYLVDELRALLGSTG